ncbi:MAG TPA: DUF3303 family protein [Candidatus Acidoferrales bacterium]|nr:DUF3303 family protein [Candidatus Acidoferrales bacterium]
MPFMVIETFKEENAKAVGKRLKHRVRMLPDGGTDHASWIRTDGKKCFPVMEPADFSSLEKWTRHGKDLVDFEIILAQTSAEYWSEARPR